MEQLFECLMPYIHNDDLNSVSLVSRKLYELDSLTRKHVTVHVYYAAIPNPTPTLTPSRLSTRFPNIESLTLKGIPYELESDSFEGIEDISATPWIEQLTVVDSFKRLKELCIRNMVVWDLDIELLARMRGKDLRVLKIEWCRGFCEDGLMYMSKYCHGLKTLCLDNNYGGYYDASEGEEIVEKDGKWLHKLALNSKVIASFHLCHNPFVIDVKDITLLARNCSESLVSLNIDPCSLSNLTDAFGHAIRLKKIDSVRFDERMDSVNIKFPPNICCFGICDLPVSSFTSLPPFANKMRELNLQCKILKGICQCSLFEICPGLEVLYTEDGCGDTGLEVIGQCCKKLRKLTHNGLVTHMGVIALAQGCSSLEYLKVKLRDIKNDAMECIGTHLKNLQKFRMELVKTIDLPLDNGIQAMLIGCSKLERLDISLHRGGLTDVGMGYIGKYGHKLRYLSLGYTGESDAGLVQLSKGCPRLRKLKLKYCPFSEKAVANFVINVDSLRYVWVLSDYDTVSHKLIVASFRDGHRIETVRYTRYHWEQMEVV